MKIGMIFIEWNKVLSKKEIFLHILIGGLLGYGYAIFDLVANDIINYSL